MLAPSVRHMAFERADGTPFAFIPGQFVQVHFTYPDGKPTKRSYSVATVGAGDGAPVQRIEMAVSYVEGGAATDLLGHLQDGQDIDGSGPYGRFCLTEADTNKRYILVATGTGVTPYRSMLPQLKKLIESRSIEVALIYGARNSGELLYSDEFEAFAQQHAQFQFYACLSREARVHARAHDRRGHVQVAIEEIKPNAETDIAYLCGNPNMVDQAFNQLKEAGLPIPHIRREKYVSSR